MSTDTRATNILGFHPSTAGNAIFAVLFALATGGHLYTRIRLHASFFNALIVGSFFEIIGYCARAAVGGHLTSIALYATQSLFLLLAPILFAATCYMILGRIIYTTRSERYSTVPVRRLTMTFVIADVVCFLVQAGGGGLQTVGGNSTLPEIGEWVVVAGLIMQIICFGFFCAIAIAFHTRFRRHSPPDEASSEVPWQRLMWVLYAASALIIIRNIVRVAEYAEGFSGWIMTHEAMLFVFDAVPMLSLLALLLLFHPARLLKGYLDGYKHAKKEQFELYESS